MGHLTFLIMKDIIKAELCLRKMVIIYNIFFWVIGPAIIGLGIWFYIIQSLHEPLVSGGDLEGPAILIIIAGALSVVAGIVGCLGGVNEHRKLLHAYFVLMFIVCALEVSSAVWVFTEYDKVEDRIRGDLTHKIRTAYGVDYTTTKKINDLQRKYRCCGLDSPFDWPKWRAADNRSDVTLQLPDFNKTDALPLDLVPEEVASRATTVFPGKDVKLPYTCCSPVIQESCTFYDKRLSTKGCLNHYVSWFRHIFMIVGWAIFGMACTQLVALAVICCFSKAVSVVTA